MPNPQIDAADNTNKVANISSNADASLSQALWDGMKEYTGIAKLERIGTLAGVGPDTLKDFYSFDDGKGSFDDAAKTHVENSMNGLQREKLEKERDQYREDSVRYALLGGKEPVKGPMMQEFDKEVARAREQAEKQVKAAMTSQEMKQYLEEAKWYRAQQALGAPLFGGPGIGGPALIALGAIEKGPAMQEYEKRVQAQIQRQPVRWDGK